MKHWRIWRIQHPFMRTDYMFGAHLFDIHHLSMHTLNYFHWLFLPVFVSSLLNHCTFFDDQCYPFRLSIFTLMKFALVSVINLWLSYFNRIDLNIEKSLPISKYYSVLSTDKVGHACLNGQVSRNFSNDNILYWLSKQTIALYHDIKFEKNIRRPNAMLQHFKAYSFLVFNFLLFPPHCLLPFR